jgi:nicotinate-nucleotide adenylyltransferase
MGADSARDLGSWKDHETLLDESHVVVLGRPGAREDSIPPDIGRHVTILPTPLVQVSSTDIRRRAGAGESIRYMVTDEVEKYIRVEMLYGPGKDRT